MKTKILMIMGLISFISLSVHANGFDRKSAELGVKAGMYIEKNKNNILSWSRLIAYETLKNEAQKHHCNLKHAPSKDGGSELGRGLCTFVNQNSKQEVFEGLNALSYAVLNTYEDKKEDAVCATSLALFITRNYPAAKKLADMSKRYNYDSKLCKTAQNIVKLGLAYEIKYHNFVEPGNVCVQ